MKFCSECGQQVTHKVPELDDRKRYVCDSCGVIHYQNPKVIVGSLPVWQDQVLLCRRAIEPRYGYWTLPAGFMENGETTLEGAIRETQEEAGALLKDGTLYRLFDIPMINQVYLFYLAELQTPGMDPGIESLEVRMFDEADIPWDELAFPVMNDVLKEFFDDRRKNQYPVRTGLPSFRLKPAAS
ncbi:NADH pyrophosphatase [BD1-7 clade bacterium]|uniref:NADH pyrophosphatase n=1 Tax=BD1-7 clade bacterium TaxID=2029982 RepID=A0A5S9QK65_9GAMM|nr:NADH pyrophosphatase [BD1-7 clade bacterium]